ncbi:MAG: D-aminoacyl-tRNA deacylase [Deltaproteobacteria bacterium]|jgi:D-tyrosyl-tRNA(Tyr) deacylase|nr:D-aminoacyl-tRNA deacylase [Deltaproteobacteria bacterium]
MCNSEGRQGLVSRKVWSLLAEKGGTAAAGFSFQGAEVLKQRDERGNEYYFVPTEVPVCLDYPKYLPEMNGHFGAFDIAGMVTWHEGGSAPPKVLTVHSIGDVKAGVYGPTNPVYSRNLLRAMARGRAAFGLDEYEVMTEATHWSGSHVSGTPAELMRQFPVPMLDIEVGSAPGGWDNPEACRALAEALLQVFDSDEKRLRNILCLGGTHFEANFSQAVFTDWQTGEGAETFGVSHVLANQWLVSGEYEKERGLAFASAAVEAIAGGIEAVAFHDKLKGCYKDLARALGEKYGVPILKHQRLRNPAEIQW